MCVMVNSTCYSLQAFKSVHDEGPSCWNGTSGSVLCLTRAALALVRLALATLVRFISQRMDQLRT
jgi:hypothetical protein